MILSKTMREDDCSVQMFIIIFLYVYAYTQVSAPPVKLSYTKRSVLTLTCSLGMAYIYVTSTPTSSARHTNTTQLPCQLCSYSQDPPALEQSSGRYFAIVGTYFTFLFVVKVLFYVISFNFGLFVYSFINLLLLLFVI